METQDHIYDLLEANDLPAKFELIDIFRSQIGKSNKNLDLNSILFNYQLDLDAKHRITTFDRIRFYGPGKGLSAFVANQLFLSLHVISIENKALVLENLTTVLDNLTDSNSPLLKVTQAKRLVDHLSNFFGDQFWKITSHRFLSIFVVPFENELQNAAFDINTHSISVFKTKNKKHQSPEYIFLHEFGHILHSVLLKSIDKVPQSFVEFNRGFNESFFNYSQRDQLEIYADLFSIAVMIETEYEHLNPLIKRISKTTLLKIKDYFLQEIKAVSAIPGKSAFDNLFSSMTPDVEI